MGVSGWKFLLVPAYPGCPGSKAVKRSLLLLLLLDVIRIQQLTCWKRQRCANPSPGTSCCLWVGTDRTDSPQSQAAVGCESQPADNTRHKLLQCWEPAAASLSTHLQIYTMNQKINNNNLFQHLSMLIQRFNSVLITDSFCFADEDPDL